MDTAVVLTMMLFHSIFFCFADIYRTGHEESEDKASKLEYIKSMKQVTGVQKNISISQPEIQERWTFHCPE